MLAPSFNQGSAVMNVPKHLIATDGVNSSNIGSSIRQTPVISTTGNNTSNRFTDGAANIYCASDMKFMPDSTISTKRNSVVTNNVTREGSMRGSAQKPSEAQQRAKQQSRHSRKNGALSST